MRGRKPRLVSRITSLPLRPRITKRTRLSTETQDHLLLVRFVGRRTRVCVFNRLGKTHETIVKSLCMQASMPHCQRLKRAWWPSGPAWWHWQATMLHWGEWRLLPCGGTATDCGRTGGRRWPKETGSRWGQCASWVSVVRSHPWTMVFIRARRRHQIETWCSYSVLIDFSALLLGSSELLTQTDSADNVFVFECKQNKNRKIEDWSVFSIDWCWIFIDGEYTLRTNTFVGWLHGTLCWTGG